MNEIRQRMSVSMSESESYRKREIESKYTCVKLTTREHTANAIAAIADVSHNSRRNVMNALLLL